MEPKLITHSRTVWFNALIAVLSVLCAQTELLRPYVSDGGYLVLLLVSAAGNVYLRSITQTPVRLR